MQVDDCYNLLVSQPGLSGGRKHLLSLSAQGLQSPKKEVFKWHSLQQITETVMVLKHEER